MSEKLPEKMEVDTNLHFLSESSSCEVRISSVARFFEVSKEARPK